MLAEVVPIVFPDLDTPAFQRSFVLTSAWAGGVGTDVASDLEVAKNDLQPFRSVSTNFSSKNGPKNWNFDSVKSAALVKRRNLDEKGLKLPDI